ncbi:MAG: GTP cyclohydrolase I FolE [Melioribacteraceae bacterium]|nr:GTP cyclohydrolase I FolE [Melioribacteraceae bacterium]
MRDPSMNKMAEEIGDEHFSETLYTPLRKDAFILDDKTKIEEIEKLFERIMYTLGLDLSDDSLRGTPHRVAKMYVKEIFSGLNPENKPQARSFSNKYEYKGIVLEKDIDVTSTCEHHFVPIIGKAHIAYIPNGKVVGLSKLNRIVDYYARRPQVQERMNKQILNELKDVLGTDDVAVIIDAKHFCVHTRGIKDTGSSTITAEYSGSFINAEKKAELMNLLNGRLL